MGYFKIIEQGNGIFYISEMLGVGSHLLMGDEKALLIDTGYGYGNLRKEVEKITDKPVIVINSHVHPDHSMGNGQFEEVYVCAADLPRIHNGELSDLNELLMGYAKKKVPPVYLFLLYDRLKKKPSYETIYKELSESNTFELGGRSIKLLEMPGHTPGSIIVLDEKSRSVFAGDAVNPAALLHFKRDFKLKEYAKQLDALAELTGYDYLYTSHIKKPLPFSFVDWFADFLRRVDITKSKKSDLPNYGRTVYEYTENGGPYGRCKTSFDEDNL